MLGVLLITSSITAAASFQFLGVESVFGNPSKVSEVYSFAIVITSGREQIPGIPQKYRGTLRKYFVYQTRVKVDGNTYYRLAAGNFTDSETARIALQQLRQSFANAWIYRRSPPEVKQLTNFINQPSPASSNHTTGNEPDTTIVTAGTTGNAPDATVMAANTNEQLLAMARQEFIDTNYARVIAIADKVTATGSLKQAREAIELAGITRERQGKFEQAIVLYEALLDTDPSAENAARIQGRIEGIRSMSLTPKARIVVKEKNPDDDAWDFRGILQQFYLDDLIDRDGDDSESINRVLVTDVDMFIRKKTDTDTLEFRVDAGLVNDFLENSNDSRVSNASVQYSRDSFRLTGGRQTRTLTGVYGRFDGLTFNDLSHPDFQLSYGYGLLVESAFDDPDSNRPFVGTNLEFSPYPGVDVDLYLVHQEIYGLIDRQAVGGEVRFQNQAGFAYGTADYDIFYEKLTNFSFISNYQVNRKMSLNTTLSKGHSPTLSTINALQGQAVATIDDLKEVFTSDQIYQLAQDRTSESENIIIGANYRLEANRNLYINFSSFKLDATETSGGVERIPSSENIELSLDYSFQGLFFERDYAMLGTRVSDADTNQAVSVNMRTRFTGYKNISFDPRLELTRREDKDGEFDQWIANPSIKLRYRASKKLNLEGTFGIEYSDLDLPELDKQYIYSMYLGYYYLF